MKRFKYRGIYLFLLTIALGLTNCAIPQRNAAESVSFEKFSKGAHKGQITQAQLQDELLRFESQFNARIQSANQALETSANPKLRYRALLNRLVYSSNSLNIALGPSPETNFLDMVTFIELSRDVLKNYWIPKVFGADGGALDQAFAESSGQIWVIAEAVLSPEQKNVLQNVISIWRNKHPDQINVEAVRLSSFATQAGAKSAGLDQNVGGLFASVQQSTQAVDAARLFAERALYYAERAPFLFRLQARLGAHEVLDDSSLSLGEALAPEHERAMTNLLKEFQQTLLITRTTLDDANSTVKSVSTLMGQLSDNPNAAHSATVTITQLTQLLKEWNHLLSSTPGQSGMPQMAGIAKSIDQESNRFINKLIWSGAGLIAFFWIMFVIAKLTYQYFLPKVLSRAGSTRRNGHNNKAA